MFFKCKDGRYILSLNDIPSFDDFCSLMKIKKNTFSSRVMWKIFREIFVYPNNERLLYEKFYLIEYSTFKSYLEKTKSVYVDEDILLKDNLFIINTDFMLLSKSYDSEYLNQIFEILSMDDNNED